MRTARAPLAALWLLATSFTHATASEDTVLVVDANGGGDFTEIADALPHTGEGWTILVRNGTYADPVVIGNQGLTLVAEAGSTVHLAEQIVVRDLGKTRDVILSGLHLDLGFHIENCTGLVRVQDCLTVNPEIYDDPNGYWDNCHPEVSRHTVLGCRAVTLVGCELHGATGADAPNKAYPYDPLPGHPALYVEDSAVTLYSTTLRGGDGGSTLVTHSAGGGGGDALFLGSASSARVCSPNSFSGGLGGYGDVTYGCDGLPVYLNGGTVEYSAHAELTLSVPAVLRGDVSSTMKVTGPPGAGAFLLTSAEPHWRPLPAGVGVLHLLQPFTVSKLGTIPGTGVLETTVLLPPPPAQDKFLGFQYQVFAVQDAARFLSNPRRSVLLHPDL